jgi:hypothetical protein
MSIELKGKNVTEDPRLDRIPEFDEKSRLFSIRETLETRKPRSYTWRCNKWLDQKNEGACVGFSFAHELAARPFEFRNITDSDAREYYFRAQQLDDWPGGSYPGASPFYEGTSILAGAKAIVEKGHIEEYRWAFGVEDLVLAIGHSGPAVIGVNWYESMFNVGTDGYLRVSGQKTGGHAILVRGYNSVARRFMLRNSWGKNWGRNGDCFISYEDMERLLNEKGEACIPMIRKSENRKS